MWLLTKPGFPKEWKSFPNFDALVSDRDFDEESFLALSGIQHFAFCRRQWALIHIERVWSENELTVQGSLMHKRAHNEAVRERRGDVITVRGLKVHSRRLGIWGACDVVEFHADPQGHSLAGEDGLWRAAPVEYKLGASKPIDADRLQLCAQALCLEEMLAEDVSVGYIFYGRTRSRERVDMTTALRDGVLQAIAEMHRLYDRRHVPRVKPFAACRSCSLVQACMPNASGKRVGDYIESWLKDSL